MMCHLILHAGYAAEVLGILDFYAVAKYNQNDIVSLTRKLRAKGMRDQHIRIVLGLRERRPFMADPQYLAAFDRFYQQSSTEGRAREPSLKLDVLV